MRNGTKIILACVTAASLLAGGCGQGRYTREGMSLAEARQRQMKSGTEWSMARQAFLAGDMKKALKRVEQSIEINPDVPKSHVLLGRIHMEQSQLGPALEAFNEAERLDAEHVDAVYYQGLVYERLQKRERAFERFTRASEIDPANAQYLVAAAEMLIDQGKLDEAETFLNERGEDFEHNPGVHHTLAHIALLKGEHDRAVTLFRETQLLAPDDAGVSEDLAQAYVEAGRFAEADFLLSSLLSHDDLKDRRDLRHLRVRCLVELDRPVDARTELLALTEGNQGASDVEAWIGLGNVAYTLGQDLQLRRASARVVALAPERFEGYVLQALAQRSRGELDHATKSIARAVQLAPAEPSALLFQAVILNDKGDVTGARASLQRVLELQPRNEVANEFLAAITARARYATVPTDND